MLAPSRIIALGGSYVGIAEGIDGNAANVATPAVREPFSFQNVEFDVSGNVYFPGAFAGTDFENRGSIPTRQSAGVENFLYVNTAAMMAVGAFGAAFTLDYQSFTVRGAGSGPSRDLRILRSNLQLAYGFFHHQLSVGVGVQGVTSYFSEGGSALAPASGVSPSAGMLLRLDEQPWRFGVTVRGPVTSGNHSSGTYGADGVRSTAGYILPDQIVVPAQLEAGVAVQLGPRPLNPRWIDPSEQDVELRKRVDDARELRQAQRVRMLAAALPAERDALEDRLDREERAIRSVEENYLDAEHERLFDERRARYENWPRPHVLLVASAVITAPVANGIAVSSFLDQKLESYGRSFSVSPRYGVEGEPLPDRFKLRLGGYLEPSLFEGGTARQHFTFGGDIKLFPFDMFGILPKGTTWQLSFATDLAPRYSNWGLGIGVWR